MRNRALPSLAIAAALLAGAACGGDDEDDAIIDSGRPTSDASDGSSTTVTTDDTDDTGGDDTGGHQGVSDRVPEPSDLAIALRHPSGVSLELDRIELEGQDIVIDARIHNPSLQAITFHPGNSGSNRLRLLDDADNEYVFIEPGEGGSIDLDPGDTLDATLAFRGPLWGEPDELRLVTNIYPDAVGDFDLDSEYDGTASPGFVAPIELEWG